MDTTVEDVTGKKRGRVPGDYDENDALFKRRKVICQYGRNCYRRSPSHFKDYQHPELEALLLEALKSNCPLNTVDCGDEFPDPVVVHEQLAILYNSGILDLIKAEKLPSKTVPITPSSTSTSTIPNPDVAEELHSTPSTSNTSNCSRSTEKSDPAGDPGITWENNERSQCETVLSKWNASCPFNFFLTSLPQENVPYSLSFADLFHPSLGEVKRVCHFNFMVEADWFLEETQRAGIEEKESTVIHGVESPALEEASRAFPLLKVHLVKSPFPFGHHHTKMSLIEYRDGSMRFVIYTANLIQSDWENRTQGIWMGPRCARIAAEEIKRAQRCVGSDFKADITEYLKSYPAKCLLSHWINAIQLLDFSEIKVIFVGSVPVTSRSSHSGFQFGLKKMEKTLKRFPAPAEIDSSWPFFIQCSSIGSLGQSDEWLRSELGRDLMGRRSWMSSTPIRVIYPSDQNVRKSVGGLSGGSCLPYSKRTHLKQLWLRKYLYSWKSDKVRRSRIMPHIKTYSRVSPDGTKLGWFLLTSANLSKAAWGKMNKNQDGLTIMSWEAGVLFIPQNFGFQDSFPISKTDDRKVEEFLLPFDVPLSKYEASDSPWFIETLRDDLQS